VGDAWKEWNGKFRDDVRDFFRSEPGSLRRMADRIVGSPEIYGHKQREAEQSVNFVTCHDGFTLNDLVSFNQKHNEANGEENRDGANDNRSWNCGAEGPTDDRKIENLRNRQVKNFLTATLLSLGMPMILMGDEVRRTQRGNNNDYCHDDETNWFDWTLVQRHADVYRFVSLLCQRRVLREVAHERISLSKMLADAKKSWNGLKLGQADWGDNSHSVALGGEVYGEGLLFYWILSAYWEALDVEPPPAGKVWRRWIDTARESPDDIVPWDTAPSVTASSYRVEPRSVVMLFIEGAAP
jgi:isoamylase